MKRVIDFSVVFVILLVLAYLYPVYFPSEPVKPTKMVQQVDNVTKHQTNSKIKQLPADGLAKYIGTDIVSYRTKFGEPLEIQPIDDLEAWWIYGEEATDYLQLKVRQNKIIAIFALGKRSTIQPFRMTMPLHQVADLTPIYSDFTVTTGKEKVQFDLSEKEMSRIPLISFDNESYAILQFDYQTSRLLAVQYFSAAELLKQAPYQMDSPSKNKRAQSERQFSEEEKQGMERQVFSIFNHLRVQQQLSSLAFSSLLKQDAEKIADIFWQNPTRFSQHIQKKLPMNPTSKRLPLTTNEEKRLLQLVNRNPKDTSLYLLSGNAYIPYLAVSCFANRKGYPRLQQDSLQNIGLVIRPEGVVLLMAEQDKSVMETESSESK